MPSTAHDYRYSPLSMRSVFRFAFLSEASGFLGVVAKGFRETRGKQTPGGPSSCRAFVGPDGSRCQGADGHQCSRRIYRCYWTYNTGNSRWRINPFEYKSMWMDIQMKRYLFLVLIALECFFPASAQVINGTEEGLKLVEQVP